jgi:hypothetical protein
MNATYRMVLWGVAPIGMTLGGFLGGAVGLRTALVISLSLMASPLLWLFFSPAVRLTEMPAGPPADASLPGSLAQEEPSP